ncbi:MAG: hypothetical protein KKC46_20705 [Proteobacteria bacterium]|nr:hypothetical protein [Pseudomonadota bacterium]
MKLLSYLIVVVSLLFLIFYAYAGDYTNKKNEYSVKRIPTELVTSFFEKANFACDTKNSEVFMDLYTEKVQIWLQSYKGEKLDNYMALICSQLESFYKGLEVESKKYSYGFVSYKKPYSKKATTGICVFKKGNCIEVLPAIIENGQIKINEH